MTDVEARIRDSLRHGATELPAEPLAGEPVRRMARARRVRQAVVSSGLVLAVVTGTVLAVASPSGDRTPPADPAPPAGRTSADPSPSVPPMWPPRGEGVTDPRVSRRVGTMLSAAGMTGPFTVLYRRVAAGHETIVAQVETPKTVRWALLEATAGAPLVVRSSGVLGKGYDPEFVMAPEQDFLLVGSAGVTRVEFVVREPAGERRVVRDVVGGVLRTALPAPLPSQDDLRDTGPVLTSIEVFAGDRSVGIVGFARHR